MDEFFREIKTKLDILKHNLIKNYVPLEGRSKMSFMYSQAFNFYTFHTYN